MKNKLTIILMLVTTMFYGQWVQQNSGTTETLNDIFAVTENLVFAVGNNGTILKTTDGGANWVQKNSGTLFDLEKITSISENVSYVIGNKFNFGYIGSIYKTVNGGNDWINIVTENNLIRDISLINESIFYYSSNGVLKKTINGGVLFSTVNATQNIENIQFINELNGFASSSGLLIKTSDGGLTWTEIGNVDFFFNNSIYNFIDENIGFKKMNNQIFKTNDGGMSYTYLSTISHSMGEIIASDQNTVWGIAVELLLNGQPNFTTRIETNNLNEIQRIDNEEPLLRAIDFSNPTVGYGITFGGGIFKNITGTMLGLNDFQFKDKFTVFPIPATNEINISLREEQFLKFFINITDSLGKKIYENNFQYTENIKISTEEFSKGIYFLSISNIKGKQTEKIIIK